MHIIEELKASVSELKNHWDLINTDSKEIHGYSISDDASHEASDLQLAGAWLYADLVHADPKGNRVSFPKKDYLYLLNHHKLHQWKCGGSEN